MIGRALVAVLLSLGVGEAAAFERPAMVSPGPVHALPISGASAARDVGHAIAMLRYRYLEAERRWRFGPYVLVTGASAAEPPLVWVSSSGSHVERVRQDHFRVTFAAGSGLFRSVDCRQSEWPRFRCSDGVDRAMSAPSPTRIVFGGIAFDRLLPQAGAGLVAELE